MTASRVAAIDRSVATTCHWLDQVAVDLGDPGDRERAYHVLSAVLHTLRDRLPVAAVVHLGAQLPVHLRGSYYTEWRATSPTKYHRAAEFLDRVAAAANLTGATQASFAVEATSRLLRRHLTPGELSHVRAALPAEIAELFDGGPLADY